jgi:hypothetical protein
MMQTLMSRRISAGLLACGALGGAVLDPKNIRGCGGGVLLLFNGTTYVGDVFFVEHRMTSFRGAASVLVCIFTKRQIGYENAPMLKN